MRVRCDLAFEAMRCNTQNQGFTIKKKEEEHCIYQHIQVIDEINDLNQPVGEYISIEFDQLDDKKHRQKIAKLIQEAILELMDENALKILVVGLGNDEVCADSLGPKVISNIMITSHLYESYKDKGCRCVSSMIPRVMGQTGIETAEIIKAITQSIPFDCVIVVDALATTSLSRINRVIQISNIGISPGSGVGNHREAINEETLHIPVISVGVATVVSIESLFKELILKEKWITEETLTKILDQNECYKMIVTPKEIDEKMHHLVKVLSDGINYAIHPEFENL